MRSIKAGTTDQSTVVRIVDSVTGDPETGVTHSTPGLAVYYRREGGLLTAITTLSTLAALNTAHTDAGIKHISDGYYRVDVPDDAFAAGSAGVLITGTATGMVMIGSYHALNEPVDAIAVSGDATAADNLEAILDGTGGITLGSMTITSSTGAGLTISSTGGNGSGLVLAGNGTGDGMKTTGGATGHGLEAIGGATSGNGAYIRSQAGTAEGSYGLRAVGAGSSDSGGIVAMALTNGDGLECKAAGADRHGFYLVGAGAGEGIHATAGSAANGHGAHFEGVGANSSGLLLSRGGPGGKDLRFFNNSCTVPEVTSVLGLANDVITAASMHTGASGEIADAVWDEAVADHTTGTTFGGKLQTAVSTPPTADAVADQVWDEAAADHTGALTTGGVLQSETALEHRVSGTVVSVPAANQITTDLASSTNDQYVGRQIVFTSGAASGSAALILDYVGATKTLVHAPLVMIPAHDDTFVLV